jgi:Rha family phage regulatory protein
MRTTESVIVAPTPSQLVTLDGDHLVTDSRIVAKVFGKQHKNILRAIDEMRASLNVEIAEHGRLNFEPTNYIDRHNRIQPEYRMTKDGLSELAMSFTGDQARVCRIRFIAAFNAMAEQIASGEKNLWQKMYELEVQDAASHVKASYGSHLMLSRKRELPRLRTQRKELESAIQPKLSFH